MSDILKSCRCCGAKYDLRYWDRLRLCGYMQDGAGGHLELRDCVCGNTMTLPVLLDGETPSVRFPAFPPMLSMRGPWLAERPLA